MSERVVVVGQGAREHALAHKLAYGADEKNRVREVIVIGGNAGIAQDFECIIGKTSVKEIVDACKKIAPDLVVIGPESYLADGIIDALLEEGLIAFGPRKDAALLESSKHFAKTICDDANVATAAYQRFLDLQSALKGVEDYPFSDLVIKVDGLCAGKGVTVCRDKDAAKQTLIALFAQGGFLKLGAKPVVLLEEFIPGSEVSVFGLANGEDVVLFCPMQDYKRLWNFDEGPNTGGMGAVGPLGTEHQRKVFLNRIKEEIFRPTLRAMVKNGRKFSGLLYAGLMLTKGKAFLLEFNVRFGDPETQALLFGTRADIYPLLFAIAHNASFDQEMWQKKLLEMEPTIAIVMASEGYPLSPKTASVPITLPKAVSDRIKIFFASTTAHSGNLMAGSGRVMSVVARGGGVDEARALGYEAVREIVFSGMQYRQDIGTHVTDLLYSG